MSQQFSISGKVQDENKMPLDLSQVLLLAAPDSTLLLSSYSDQDGSFKFEALDSGNYVIQVSMLGMETRMQPVQVQNKNIELPPIQLNSLLNELGEATVSTEIPFVERKIDRIVVNPEALATNAGTSALDIMERSPGIQLNSDGFLMLKGRGGVTVFINDKPTYMSGTELQNYLRSLPTGAIKQIEIMENPPAQYDAAGNSVIINIVLKRTAILGFYGNFNTGYRQGRYANSNNNLNLNYNRQKLSLFASINAGFWNTYQDLNINRFYQDGDGQLSSSFRQNSYIRPQGEYLNANFGADYYINDRTSFGFSSRLNTSWEDRTTDNIALVQNPDGSLIQQVNADNSEDGLNENYVYSGYVRHKMDSLGQQITLDIDHVQYRSQQDQVFLNDLINPNGQLDGQNRVDGDLPSLIKIYAAKLDYEKPFENGLKFDAGMKSAFTETDNEAIYTNTEEGVTTPDYNLSNRFLYDEWIHTGYVNFSKGYHKIDFQAGLRGEITVMDGEQLGNLEQPDSSFTRTFESLFPTTFIAWRIDSNMVHQLTFSYGSRID
ncbi:MAG: outer membrane beta-barrel protein [Flavobacteriales bacterium]|nr:outer membrane beta-barrel protein [Flavobacteriales bacterium]